MSVFNEKITLTNARDTGNAKTGLIASAEVRSVTVEACVDTGSWFLVINEKIRAALGLETVGSQKATLANGASEAYPVTEPVNFRWKNREMGMNALFIPEADEVLFGALCMEALDLIADPIDECLKGRHGETALYKLK